MIDAEQGGVGSWCTCKTDHEPHSRRQVNDVMNDMQQGEAYKESKGPLPRVCMYVLVAMQCGRVP